MLGLIGIDQITAQPRLTFDRLELLDGIGLVPIVMGLFGVAEILSNLEQELKREVITGAHRRPVALARRLGGVASGPIMRGTVLGFFLGILPGGGAVIASFASYAIEKKLSAHAGALRQGRHRGRGRARRRPTTRPPAAPSFRC